MSLEAYLIVNLAALIGTGLLVVYIILKEGDFYK